MNEMRLQTINPEKARGKIESAYGLISFANGYNFMQSIGLQEAREEVKSYANLVKEQQVNEDGEKLPIAEVLGKEIVVTGYDMRPSNMHQKDYLCLKFEMDGKKHVIFTDSEVLQRECNRFRDDMPFNAKIIQKGQYFTFA